MKALTASDLRIGDVVYWTAANAWSRNIADALLMDDDAAAAALANAKKNETLIVNAYLIVMEAPSKVAAREAVREDIRAIGPTTHPEHGKQAGGA
jgi:hypothetical protein